MAQQLIGRSRELKALREYLNSDKSEFIAVYGRRRVGKTFLIRKAAEVNKEYEEKLSNKINTFSEETGTKKSLLLTMIATYGVKQNTYSDIVQSEIVLDDLFA